MTILLVEDNRRLARSLTKGLEEEALQISHVASGGAALELLNLQPFEIVILDLGLPDMDGLDVISSVRDRGSAIPILVLTARDAIEMRVEALNRGADDYLVKPFAFAELVARISALARRATAPRWVPLTGVPGLKLLPGEMDVLIAGQRVRLSPREHALLETLLRRCGETVLREEILRDVFGYNFDPGTNLIDVHIAHIRKKVAGAPIAIETMRGLGYRLVQTSTPKPAAGR